MSTLSVGLQGQAVQQVTEQLTAQQMGSGDVPVYATPAMVALMEAAAVNCVSKYLQEGETSVGKTLSEMRVMMLLYRHGYLGLSYRRDSYWNDRDCYCDNRGDRGQEDKIQSGGQGRQGHHRTRHPRESYRGQGEIPQARTR